MVGTGSTLVAALRAGRQSYGIELNPAYAALADEAVQAERLSLGEAAAGLAGGRHPGRCCPAGCAFQRTRDPA